eukprot:TRINITY_DN5351_c0_g2_i1.p1 TRINITY_DN5351_c0_g2~~TRINITY_DN5351_c0_g2_i1.p1  ORF type:complete len:158 (+),score=5.03 TRINITY_DN5351_c0_g2_i1:147-620(+)
MFEVVSLMIAFILQILLIAICMYVLICLTDLEQDFLNPQDCAKRVNDFMYPELGLLVALVLELAVTGKFILSIIIGLVLGYQGRSWWRRELFLDQMEIFNQCIFEKRKRTGMLCVHFAMFMVILYRLITSALGMLTPSGREMVKRLFDEAAATLHHY